MRMYCFLLNGSQRILSIIQILPNLEKMDFLYQHSDQENIKIEDNSDHYLFNSLLNQAKTDQDHYIDGLFSPEIPLIPSCQIIQSITLPQERMIKQVGTYINMKTTPINDIMTYIDQYYPLSGSSHKRIYLAVRKVKLQLKREQARKRNIHLLKEEKFEVQKVVSQLQQQDIKAQDSQVSPIIFEDQSQETRKKKRNRMSAQNSRDRKKEYILEIENQNKQLRKKIAELTKGTSKNRNQIPQSAFSEKFRPQGKDFIKLIVCLGITCFVNLNQSQAFDSPCHKINSILQQYTQQEKNSIQAIEETEQKIQLKKIQLQIQNLKQALPKQKQNKLQQLLARIQTSPLQIDSFQQSKHFELNKFNQKLEVQRKLMKKQFDSNKKASLLKVKNSKCINKRITI